MGLLEERQKLLEKRKEPPKNEESTVDEIETVVIAEVTENNTEPFEQKVSVDAELIETNKVITSDDEKIEEKNEVIEFSPIKKVDSIDPQTNGSMTGKVKKLHFQLNRSLLVNSSILTIGALLIGFGVESFHIPTPVHESKTLIVTQKVFVPKTVTTTIKVSKVAPFRDGFVLLHGIGTSGKSKPTGESKSKAKTNAPVPSTLPSTVHTSSPTSSTISTKKPSKPSPTQTQTKKPIIQVQHKKPVIPKPKHPKAPTNPQNQTSVVVKKPSKPVISPKPSKPPVVTTTKRVDPIKNAEFNVLKNVYSVFRGVLGDYFKTNKVTSLEQISVVEWSGFVDYGIQNGQFGSNPPKIDYQVILFDHNAIDQGAFNQMEISWGGHLYGNVNDFESGIAKKYGQLIRYNDSGYFQAEMNNKFLFNPPFQPSNLGFPVSTIR